VLEGAVEILDWHPPYIAAELNPAGMKELGHDTEDFRAFMRQFGYDLFLLSSSDGVPVFVPKNTRLSYIDDFVVANGLFSTLDDVAKLWPETLANV